MDLGYHVYLALAREVGRDDKLAAFVLAYRDRACGSLECVDVHIVNDISELVVAALLAVAAVLVNVLDHFCHFVKCPFVALYKVVGRLFNVVGFEEILVVECTYHHPEKVGGDVSGAEVELVVDGAFVHKSLRPPRLFNIEVLGVEKVGGVSLKRELCGGTAVCCVNVILARGRKSGVGVHLLNICLLSCRGRAGDLNEFQLYAESFFDS